ncbi:MAG: MBG domain-containing protein [Clostridiales bacterium]|nr:MBG domain-containing protein [Clostridiales bacterium]
MKNVSHSPVTEMLSGKHKIWLIIGLALMSVADFAACIALWVFGASSAYWFLPFAMTVADLLYLAGVALSNQRFKYTLTLFIVYIIVTIVFVIIWLAEFGSSNPAILADTVEAAWGMLHVFGILAVAISYLYASRRLRLMRHVQLVFAIGLSAVVLLALVLFYGITIISDGYFGQGNDTIPLVYTYVGDNECMVTDIVYGKGDKVVIPYEFNGRKVTAVSANIFSYANIKSVTLNCDSDVALCEDLNSVRSLNTKIIIYADKKDVDTIKYNLYGEQENIIYTTLKHELGNRVRPIGLDKDEVYVTFDYDRDSYLYAQGEIIPTWYGKKGDKFVLSDFDDVDYVEYSDVNSDEDLYYCYNNIKINGGNGQIMCELQDGGKALDGMTITKSCDNVPVRFQRIYKVLAGVSNDNMYNTADWFNFATINGIKRDFKLTVADKADELLEPFDRGEAFTRHMHYSAFNTPQYREFTSLSELLSEGYSEVAIAPHWELVKPQITLSAVDGSTDFVYGDDFELTATVTHPLGDVQIEYEWYDETQRISYDQVLKENASDVGMHTYTAIVKVSAPEVTLRTSGNAAEIKVNVNKRPLTVTWEHKSIGSLGDDTQSYGTESVFDGKQRVIQPTAHNAVNNDSIYFMGATVLDAGTHTERATLSSYIAEKYYIAEGETYTYTIYPRPVPLTWGEQTEFEYDGNSHSPSAQAFDLWDSELDIRYIGTQIDAGENYTVTAEIVNTNYTIDESSEKSKGFKITPKQVSVTWGNTELTYNGEVQAPTATAVGVNNANVNLNITGGQINVNMIDGNKTATYTATATSANKNYTLDPTTASKEFTIAPYVLTGIGWSNSVVRYNGQAQLPTAMVTGAKDKNVPLTVIIEDFPEGAINAGNYTATATVADPNYTIYDGPLFPIYDDITSELTAAQWPFIILSMEVRVEWSNTALTYNGSEQTPTATAKGVNGEDLPLTVSGGRRDVGTGTATAAFATEQQNYTLTNTTVRFTVQQRVLTISVNDVTIEYGQTPDYTYTVDGLISGDNVTVTFSLNVLTVDGNIPVGKHIINVTLSGSDNGNYKLNVVRNGTLTVTAPTQTEE